MTTEIDRPPAVTGPRGIVADDGSPRAAERSRLQRWAETRTVRVLEKQRIAELAEAQVEADERELAAMDGAAAESRITGARRRSLSLGDAWRRFLANPSPWVIGASLATTLVVRVVLGGWTWTDLAIPAVMLAIFPFVEWLIHVFVLHFKPFDVAGRTVDPLVSRKHREHHADPRNLPLIFIPFPTLLQVLASQAVLAFVLAPRPELAWTWLLSLSAIGFVYEWTHYLIHSDYRPVSPLYRSVWRNHRLHHYKNENYWFSVTTANTSDRVLRTNPDPADVPNSPTAVSLQAGLGT